MPALEIKPCPLAGLMLVQRKRIEDPRGYFSRLFCVDELAAAGFDGQVMQINHTLTRQRGAVRGLHYQRAPYSEIKYVSVLAGEVFDVAVDLRAGSPTFLHWHGEILSAQNSRSYLIPRGFAHGFQTLTENCELLYLHSAPYAAAAEAALNVRDEALGVRWPLQITQISERDAAHPFIAESFAGVSP